MKKRFPKYVYQEYEQQEVIEQQKPIRGVTNEKSKHEELFVGDEEPSPAKGYFNGGGAYTEDEVALSQSILEDDFVPTESYQLDYSNPKQEPSNNSSILNKENDLSEKKTIVATSAEKRDITQDGMSNLSLSENQLADRIKQLELLKGDMIRDAKIPYKDESQFVFNDGPLDSPVMFVGEAPGEEEVTQGKPFVGKSGKLLQKMLDAAGITRDRMYITNAVVWRPPLNRTPLPAEIEEMAQYALRHIEIMKPKILVLIGGVSYRCIMREAIAISKIRGIWQSRYFCPSIVNIFHPSYLIRAQIHKRETWFDILSIRQKILETGWSLDRGVLRLNEKE